MTIVSPLSEISYVKEKWEEFSYSRKFSKEKILTEKKLKALRLNMNAERFSK